MNLITFLFPGTVGAHLMAAKEILRHSDPGRLG